MSTQGPTGDTQRTSEPVSGETQELKPLEHDGMHVRAEIQSLKAQAKDAYDQINALLQNANQEAQAAASARASIDELLNHITALHKGSQDQLDRLRKASDEAAALKTSAQQSVTQANDQVSLVAAQVKVAEAAVAAANDAGAKAAAAAAKAEQDAQVAAQRSAHIEDGRKYVDEKRADIDKVLVTANQSATQAEAKHQAAKAAIDAIKSLQDSAAASKSASQAELDEAKKLRAQIEGHANTTAKLAQVARDTDTRILAYEERLAALQSESEERLRTIVALLPGATSAGLASAFEARRQHFKVPQRCWQSGFVLSLALLLALAAWTFFGQSAPEQGMTLERLGVTLLRRLPVAAPLIWFAIYAARQAALAKNIEEDYAFKKAMSQSFEGYRREMVEIEGKVSPGSPLSLFCGNVLAEITRSPGRVYDKHRTDVSPMTALSDSARPLVDVASKIAQTKGIG